jgi:DNA-binding NtrC family response regulator
MSQARPAAHSIRTVPLELVVFLRRNRSTYSLPPAGVINIGRSAVNDIRIDHRSVSRQHIRLHLGERIELEDMGSANGTWLFPVLPPGMSAVHDETMHSADERRLAPGTRVAVALGDMVRIGLALVSIQGRTPSSKAPAWPRDVSSSDPLLLDPVMQGLYELAERAAQTPISVLILGETGVGKDVLAQSIHERSPRRGSPFLRLNCAALSPTLLESELFGYQRGAFTGAHESKEGLLESAHKGTVFLDEIGEIPMSTQAKLLTVLETGDVLRVGATKPRRVDIRIIAATNRDLADEVQCGRFRKDLYYRINAVNFVVPPLRERKTEIVPLARHFLATFCARAGVQSPQFSPEALSRLVEYSWPGNVRELKNAMERVPILCGDGPIRPEHLPADNRFALPTLYGLDEEDDDDAADPWSATTSVRPAPAGVADLAERARVLQALETCGGNQTRAAKMLGISRRTLVNRLDAYQLPRPRKQ